MSSKKIYSILSILIIVIFSVVGLYLYEKHTAVEPQIETEESISEAEAEMPLPTIKYGMAIDSLIIHKDAIRKNENLSRIFSKYNIPSEKINHLATEAQKVYNPRLIKAGHNYTVYMEKDSSAKCLVYEASPIERIVFNFDSLLVYQHLKDVDTVKRKLGGVITSSIYETLIEQNASQLIAIELSKIFSRQVDFFRIKKGERFKIIYDELHLDGRPIGISNVAAASFEHGGKTYYAFKFPQDGKEAYFDETGNSTSKGGFLKAPLKYFRITSHFTKKRLHPVQKVYKAHLGTDYAAPTGTPIIAVGDGTIQEARYSSFNGNYVKIKHSQKYATQYLHMSKIASGIKPGTKVKQGQVIGYVGSTGLATGPHVCFRFWENNKQVDGTKVKVIAKEPIKKSDKPAFEIYKNEKMAQLSTIEFHDYMDKNEAKKKDKKEDREM